MNGWQELWNDLFFHRYPFLIGLSIRILAAIIFPYFLDDGTGGVQYTDIDYHVFTDGARLVAEGRSPFERHTYRYTPFLAYFLSLFHPYIDLLSRYIFCVADALCGYLILQLRRQCRQRGYYYYGQDYDGSMTAKNKTDNNKKKLPDLLPTDSLWWLYNPLPINICTRGSAESLQILFPVLLCIAVATVGVENSVNRTKRTWQNTRSTLLPRRLEQWRHDASAIVGSDDGLVRRAFLCGCILGLAIHLKIYPLIYTLSFMTYFSRMEGAPCWQREHPEPVFLCNYDSIHHYVKRWVMRLLRPPSLAFAIATLMTSAGVTFAAVKWFGEESWTVGIAYHLSRLDHRHNYSSFWYWIYLKRAQPRGSRNIDFDIFGKLLLLPQAILLFVLSLGIGPYHLELALFLQTFLFVLQNKVITGQYFTWYLILVPLCFPGTSSAPSRNLVQQQARNKKLLKSMAFLGSSIVIWFFNAYLLEMRGVANHVPLWMASLVFYMANVNVFCVVLQMKSQEIKIDAKSSIKNAGPHNAKTVAPK